MLYVVCSVVSRTPGGWREHSRMKSPLTVTSHAQPRVNGRRSAQEKAQNSTKKKKKKTTTKNKKTKKKYHAHSKNQTRTHRERETDRHTVTQTHSSSSPYSTTVLLPSLSHQSLSSLSLPVSLCVGAGALRAPNWYRLRYCYQ